LKAGRQTRDFLALFRKSREPLDILRGGMTFEGSPLFALYVSGSEELKFHLQNNSATTGGRQKIGSASFESVKVALEAAASTEALALEKGMIVLSTAVSGGPFIGLLGTVWGVMETFSGIARANSASLTTMAPGVAGALIATVIGLLVAIPAMFAYNFMVTTIRAITQEMDAYGSQFATAIQHAYVDSRVLSDESGTAVFVKSDFESNAPLTVAETA